MRESTMAPTTLEPAPVVGRQAGAARWWGAGLAAAAVGWGTQQFAPLLLLYQARLGLAATTIQAVFAAYLVGLVPGLLLGGPFSDRLGRRRLMIPTLAVSFAATLLMVLGGRGVGWLFAGRMLAGVASGAAFSSGAAWLEELSAAGPPGGHGHAARRLTVATSLGFGVGPLVAGVLAQWAPAPTVVPYLPHLVLTGVAFPLVLRTAETRVPDRSAGLWRQVRVPEVRERRFLLLVVPLAPWVFGSASIAMIYLPGVVKAHLGGRPLVFSAVIAILTAGAGIAVQPVARRVDASGASRLLVTALGLVVAGGLAAAAAAAAVSPALVVLVALVMGSGYGCVQVLGLREVQRLARPERLAGLTAVYQAVSYVGLATPLPLAALGHHAPAWELLAAVTGLAALTLAWTARQDRATRRA